MITAEQLHVLQHSLGVDQYGQGEMYRNHYVGGSEECRPLVVMGLMVMAHPGGELTGGDPLFRVTEAGKAAMLAESPKPPKLTRGQIRYRQFLAEDCSVSFGEWLSWQKARGAA